jgi:hypothetical protein
MATRNPASVERAKNQAVREAKQASRSDLVEALARWGYVARGALYIIMGWLALQTAMGTGGKTTDPVGAMRYIAGQSYGKVLLVALVIGLIGYSLWGFVRAIFDPLHRGSDAKGWVARAGFLVSAVSYGALVLPAYKLLTTGGTGSGQAGNPRGLTVQLMSKPFGIALVYAFGLFWLVAGAGQLITAYKMTFMRDLRTGKMSQTERYWAEVLGRVGYTARAVVYGMIGIFLFRAASTANPQQAQGFDGVLAKLAQGPYGQMLLGAVALGLLLFGVYSVLSARWFTLDKSAQR